MINKKAYKNPRTQCGLSLQKMKDEKLLPEILFFEI